MKKEEIVSTQKQMEKYFQENQLRALFHELTKQLILHTPQNPMQYLIKYLSNRSNLYHTITIHGTNHEQRAKIATIVQRKLNFILIELNTILKNTYNHSHIKDYNNNSNESIHKKVIEAIKKESEKNPTKKGIIISGYPNNLKQLDLLQKTQYLPQRYFILKQSQIEGTSQETIIRDNLQQKQLFQGLKQEYDEVQTEQPIIDAMNIKCRSTPPKQSLCLLVIHPPFLVPKSLSSLLKKYCLHHVSIPKCYSKALHKDAFNKYVNEKGLTKQIQLGLIETGCKSPAGRSKGYLISGWPRNKMWVDLLPKYHLVFIFTTIKDKGFQEFKKINEENEVFLTENKPSVEKYQAMWKEYQALVDHMKHTNYAQVMPLGQSQEQLCKTFESLVQNPKIYT